MKTQLTNSKPRAATIHSQLKPVYAELRDSSVARVYLADSVDGVLAQMRNVQDSLSQENARAHESYEGMNHAYQQVCDAHSKLLERQEADEKKLQTMRFSIDEIARDCVALSKSEYADKGEQRTWKSIAARLRAIIKETTP